MYHDTPMTRIALFGAAPDTPNMGVSALFTSVVTSISQHIEPVEFVVFDNGLGRRDTILPTPDGKEIRLIRFGARGGRRYHRPENLATMLLASRLGRIGAWVNEGIRLIDSCDAVLDVSGGDSFSDIYGRQRFDNVYRPKAIAINRGRPLILMPQTYGPYKDRTVMRLAAGIVRQASMAWARDSRSFEALKVLLGDSFNPGIHLCGVDMAFGLLPSSADQYLDATLGAWLKERDPEHPLVGFNVSGLIYNDRAGAARKYGLKADYGQIVIGFLQRILDETPARVVLISHVMDQPGHYESDLAACQDVASQLGEQYLRRVAVAPTTLNESHVKWLIAQMDWFCGTRMHSTIAGLSSGVPTAAISYSDKTKGVFETCGQGDQVIDPRCMDEAGAVDQLVHSFVEHERLKAALLAHIPSVKAVAYRQTQAVADRIMTLGAT